MRRWQAILLISSALVGVLAVLWIVVSSTLPLAGYQGGRMDLKGDRLVFDSRGTIWMANVNGSERSALVLGSMPAFQSSGTVLFVRDHAIFRWTKGTGLVTRVTHPGPSEEDSSPAWSESEQRIIFQRSSYGPLRVANGSPGRSSDLYSCLADGTELTRLTRQQFFMISLSPQCSARNRIIFCGNLSQGPERRSLDAALVLDMRTGQVSRIEPEMDDVWEASISHEGDKLALVRYRSDGYHLIFEAKFGGKPTTVPIAPTRFGGPPLFTEDGLGLVFCQDPARVLSYHV